MITYEKSDDLANPEAMLQARRECEVLGIRWLPQRFLAHPKGIAPALSMVRMTWLLWREICRSDAGLVHARSYIPAAVAMVVGAFTGTPFIFDMRALWPEELITAGRLRRGSLLHKAIVAAEATCLRRASGVVSLTHAAVSHLKTTHPDALTGRRIAVIPTCVDLNRFKPRGNPPGDMAIGCLGTLLSGWFRLDWLASFFDVAARRRPDVQFVLTTRDDPLEVRMRLGGGPDVQGRLQIAGSPPDQVPQIIPRQLCSAMFYAGGEISELGRSPTRLAEILACGVPVVVNEGVGDVASIVRSYGVGVIARGPSGSEMEVAFDELERLVEDPELSARCRRAAEEVFSLETGIAAYQDLYAGIVQDLPRSEFPQPAHVQQSHT